MSEFGWGGFCGMGIVHILLDLTSVEPTWVMGVVFILVGFFGTLWSRR